MGFFFFFLFNFPPSLFAPCSRHFRFATSLSRCSVIVHLWCHFSVELAALGEGSLPRRSDARPATP
jgi:hypothetical protein